MQSYYFFAKTFLRFQLYFASYRYIVTLLLLLQ